MRLIAGKRLTAGLLLTLLCLSPVWGQAVDQAQLSGRLASPTLTGEFGQTFTPGMAGKLVAVRLFIGKHEVYDASNIIVRIREVNALGGVTDVVLASAAVPKEDIEDEPNWIEVSLNPTNPLWEQQTGVKLALTVEQESPGGLDGQNRYGTERGVPSPYLGGDFFESFMFGNPIVPSDIDMAFQTLVVAGEYVYYFRQGVDNGQGVYFEANDVTIGNQVTYYGDNYLRAEAYSPGAEKYNSLIQFNGIEKQLGSMRVIRAYLTLTFYNYGLQNSVEAIIKTQALLKPFSDDRTRCNWTQYDTGLLWEASGAQGETDRDSNYTTTYMGPHSMFDYYRDGMNVVCEIPAGVVQQWINAPATNHGLLLSMQTTQYTWAQFYSCDYTTNLTYRPLLTVFAAEGCDKISADINDDCYVDKYDLYLMSNQWLECNGGSADIVDDGDGCVNLVDYALLAAQWLKCSAPGEPLCTWPN
ncbi:MAG: DNRLRE domain-containing protein [Planctomycetes bacterium]|nr:DNRLRE domain-containing protein [Planctomycetota bacterium]